MDLNGLIEYVETEQELTEQDIEAFQLMPIEEQVDKGLAVTDLSLLKLSGDQVSFACDLNLSRFRPGDQVLLKSNTVNLLCKVIENASAEIQIELPEKRKLPKNEHYTLIAKQVQLLEPVRKALHSLIPGAPGYFHWQCLNGEKQSTPSLRGGLNEEHIEQAIASFGEWDSAQREALNKTLRKPSLLAIQGPPGTGKTRVLAVSAEVFSTYGQRVAVLAPTHQAVNNSLSEIKRLSPKRTVIKIGEAIKSEGLAEGVEILSYREFNARYQKGKIPANCIIGVTYYASIIHMIFRAGGFAPNIIMVDEAGQLPVSFGAIAGMLGAGSVILFGDDAQMPPIYHPELEHHPLSQSFFSAIRAINPSLIHPLTLTYRMNEQICSFVGEMFYSNGNGTSLLKSHEIAKGRTFELPYPLDDRSQAILNDKNSLVWVESNNDELCTQENRQEAKLIASLVGDCLNSKLSLTEIAIVTPFRRQALQIREELRSILPEESLLPIVDTVERLQGASVEIVIISYAANDPSYLSQIKRFISSKHRINVAISRAKTKVVLCSSSHLAKVSVVGENESQTFIDYIARAVNISHINI